MDMLRNVYGSVVDDLVFIMDIPYDDVSAYQNASREFLTGYHYIIDECQEHFTKVGLTQDVEAPAERWRFVV